MAELDDVVRRVTTLEQEMAQMRQEIQVTRQDAAAARVLAGGADRDVSEIRVEIRDFRQATISGLNALRENQVDMGTSLTDIDARMRDGFGKMAAGMAQIMALLTEGHG
jgi:hypothetical protein